MDQLGTRPWSLCAVADPTKARRRPERRLPRGLGPPSPSDPTLEHPTPQVCHGRHELEDMMRVWAEHGLRAELDEVAANNDLVMVGVRTPGVDAYYSRRGDDRAYSVFTVRGGRIVALRDCRDRQEALHFTGIEP